MILKYSVIENSYFKLLSQYYFFYCILDQMEAALVSIKMNSKQFDLYCIRFFYINFSKLQ